MKFTPENITELPPKSIFVFGSNTEGRHGKGAALTARKYFGAICGQAEGLQGRSWAIITKDLKLGVRSIPLNKIGKGIQNMILYARRNSDLTFYVVKLGSSLAGYTENEIKSLFLKLKKWIPKNVILPIEYEVRR